MPSQPDDEKPEEGFNEENEGGTADQSTPQDSPSANDTGGGAAVTITHSAPRTSTRANPYTRQQDPDQIGETADQANARHLDVYRALDKSSEDQFNKETPFLPSSWRAPVSKVALERAYQNSDWQAKQQQESQKLAQENDIKSRNATAEAQMRGSGQKFYKDSFGVLQPVLEEETGKALFNTSPREMGVNPDTGEPAWVSRDQYGEKKYSRPPIVAGTDPDDTKMYYNFGSGQLAPAGEISDLIKHPDITVARAAMKAKHSQDSAKWKEAIAPMKDIVAQSALAYDSASAQRDALKGQIDDINQQLGAIDPNSLTETQGGILGIGGTPTDNAMKATSQQNALMSKLDALTKQHDALDAQVKAGGALWRQREQAKNSLQMFQLKSQHDAYSNAAQERRAIVESQGGDPDKDPKLQSILQAKNYYEQTMGTVANNAQGSAGFGIAHPDTVQQQPGPNGSPDAPSQIKQANAPDLSSEPSQLAAQGVKAVGLTPVAKIAEKYGDGSQPVQPDQLMRMKQRVDDIASTLANKDTTLAPKVRDALGQESDYLSNLYAQRFATLQPDDQRKVQDATRDPTFFEKLKGLGTAALRGAAGGAADIAEFAERNAKHIPDLIVPGLSALTPKSVQDQQDKAATQATDLLNKGRGIVNDINASSSPQVEQKLRNSTGATIAGAVGGIAPYVAGGEVLGTVAKAAGLAEPTIALLTHIGSAAAGAAQSGNSMRNDAIAKLKPQLDAGTLSKDEYTKAVGLAEIAGTGVGGAAGALGPFANFAKRIGGLKAGQSFINDLLERAAKGGSDQAAKWLAGAGRQSLLNVVKEGTQQAGVGFAQDLATDLAAKGIFDPNRKIDLAKSSEAGVTQGVAGSIFSALTHVAPMVRGKGGDTGTPETTAPTPNTPAAPEAPKQAPSAEDIVKGPVATFRFQDANGATHDIQAKNIAAARSQLPDDFEEKGVRMVPNDQFKPKSAAESAEVLGKTVPPKSAIESAQVFDEKDKQDLDTERNAQKLVDQVQEATGTPREKIIEARKGKSITEWAKSLQDELDYQKNPLGTNPARRAEELRWQLAKHDFDWKDHLNKLALENAANQPGAQNWIGRTKEEAAAKAAELQSRRTAIENELTKAERLRQSPSGGEKLKGDLVAQEKGEPLPKQSAAPEAGELRALSKTIASEHGVFVKMTPDEKNGGITLDAIATSPKQRRLGKGSDALSKVKAFADEKGVPITLVADATEKGKQFDLAKFYDKNGFKRIGVDQETGKPIFRYEPKAAEPEPVKTSGKTAGLVTSETMRPEKPVPNQDAASIAKKYPGTPAVPEGQKLVEVQGVDGKKYPAAFNGYYSFKGVDYPGVGRLEGGRWSHGMLRPGEKLLTPVPDAKAWKSGIRDVNTEAAKPELKSLPEGTTTEYLGKKHAVVEGVGEPVDQWQIKLPGEDRGRTVTAEQLEKDGFKAPEITQPQNEKSNAPEIESTNALSVRQPSEGGEGVRSENPVNQESAGARPAAGAEGNGRDAAAENKGNSQEGAEALPEVEASSPERREAPQAEDNASTDAARGRETPQGTGKENAAAPSKKGKRISVGTMHDGTPDILTAIEHEGGVQTKSGASRPGGEHDDLAGSFKGVARLLLRKDGTPPDQLAQALHAQGLLPDGDVGTMNRAVEQAVEARQATKKDAGRQEYHDKFERAFLGNERARNFKRAGQSISIDDLKVGDKFEVNGEKFEVKDVDENGNVTVKDGITRVIPAGSEVFPDGGKVKKSKAKADFLSDDDLHGVQPEDKGFALKSATNEEQAKESEAAREKQKADAQREKIEALTEKPLTGDSSNVGQGQLLAGDEDLFSGESQETKQRTSDKVIEALKRAKIHQNGNLSAGTPFSLAWDGAMETAILAIKSGRAVADAVKAAIAHLRAKFPAATAEHEAQLEASIHFAHESAGADQTEAPKQKATPAEKAKKVLESPQVKKIQDSIAKAWDGPKTQSELNDTLKATRDAADTQAGRTAHEAYTTVFNELRRAVGAKDVGMAADALAFKVEAGEGGIKRLEEMKSQVSESQKASPKWRARALHAIDYAIENFDKMEAAHKQYTAFTDHQVGREQDAGMPTLRAENYVPHKQDVDDTETWKQAVGLEGGGGTAPNGSSHRKNRTFETFADSIAAGIDPHTLNAIDLLKSRVKAGETGVQLRSWEQSLKGYKDPKSGDAIAVKPERIERADGSFYYQPPKGYSIETIGNTPIAVSDEYKGMISALTDPSWIQNNKALRVASKINGAGKSVSLLIDTFHLGRLALRQSFHNLGNLAAPAPSYREGLSILDHSNAELTKMAANGEIPQKALPQILEKRANLNQLVKAGLNVGQVADNLHNDLVHKVPIIGGVNKFIFEKYTRGAMTEAALMAYDTQKSSHPELSDAENARAAAKDMNVLFGNLGRQGALVSKSAQDMARLIALAPQWNESLIRGEVGGIGQIGKSVIDAATGRRLAMGALGRQMVASTVSIFIANQIINQATRGKFTWQNPEEGIGAKLSAWIPDKIGGKGSGFFLNPMSVSSEILSTFIHGYENAGNSYEPIKDYLRGRTSALAKPLWTFFMKENASGQKVRAQDIWKETAKSAIPAPISGSAAVNAVKGVITGGNTETHPGQFQKQLFSTLGVKTDTAPSPEQRISHLATDFKRAHGIQADADYNVSDYQDLNEALRRDNAGDIKDALGDLLKKKTSQEIERKYTHYQNAPFSGKSSRETEFVRTLNPEQRATYIKAKRDRMALAQKALQFLRRAPTHQEASQN